MTFDVDVAGRVRRVRVEPAGEDRFTVTLDGQTHVVDARARRRDGGCRSCSGDRQRQCRNANRAGCGSGEKLVWLDGITAAATIERRGARPRRRPLAPHATMGTGAYSGQCPAGRPGVRRPREQV